MWQGRVVRWTPWVWWAIVVVAGLAALALVWLNRALVQPWESAVALLGMLAYATPGALIVTRRRGNRVGWRFLLIASMLSVQGVASQYALLGLRTLEQVAPLAMGAAWLQHWFSVPLLYFVSVLVLVYPDGRLSSRLWLFPLAGGLLFWTFLAITDMFARQPLDFYPLWDPLPVRLLSINPFALAVQPLPAIGDSAWSGAFLFFLVALAAPLSRYRRSQGRMRQQLRWFMFLTASLLVGFVLAGVASTLGLQIPTAFDPLAIMMLGFPLTVSVAILRHNLYDLDVVINRTLVYGALTASLALVYYASVVLLQSFLPERTALATVLSTLAVAALFAPLRRRLQAWIDRRFYHRKYDAALALATFAARARDEVDLDRLAAALVDVVQETVQPRMVGLWLVGE